MDKIIDKATLLSINICDHIIKEENTHKTSLIGMFGNINIAKFPCVYPCLYVYVAVTGGRGKQTGKLCFVNDETNKTSVKLNGDIEFPDPIAIVEMNFRITNLHLDNPGMYHFEFWLDDELIGQRSFTVKKIASTDTAP